MNFFGKKKIKDSPKKPSKGKILFTTIILCVVAFILVLSLEPQKEISTKEKEEKRRIISVESIMPADNIARIKLLGEAVPEWQATIKSKVEGVITYVSSNFRVGARVKKGEVLLEVENSQYVSYLADAEVRLSNAKNALLIEENEAEEAKENWRRSGIEGQPKSSLVFRAPQLEIAKNEVKAAEALLKKAKFDLEQTKINAPFDGSIVERNASLGESIFPGEMIALMYSDEKILVRVDVNEAQWKLLPQKLDNIDVKLLNPESETTWNAKVARIGNWLMTESRLRPIIVEVKNSDIKKPLLAGTFLNVELFGKNIENSFLVNESALTKGGYIWYVNQDSVLQSYKPIPHYYLDGKICLPLPNKVSGDINIAINPNSTYMNGFKVKPQFENRGE